MQQRRQENHRLLSARSYRDVGRDIWHSKVFNLFLLLAGIVTSVFAIIYRVEMPWFVEDGLLISGVISFLKGGYGLFKSCRNYVYPASLNNQTDDGDVLASEQASNYTMFGTPSSVLKTRNNTTDSHSKIGAGKDSGTTKSGGVAAGFGQAPSISNSALVSRKNSGTFTFFPEDGADKFDATSISLTVYGGADLGGGR